MFKYLIRLFFGTGLFLFNISNVKAETLVYVDEFDTPSLSSTYVVNDNGGMIGIQSGILSLSSVGNNFPYITLTPILPEDNYRMEVKYRINYLGHSGAGVVFANNLVLNGQTPDLADFVYYNWGDIASQREYRYLDDDGQMLYRNSTDSGNWHTIAYDRYGGRNFYYHNNSLVYASSHNLRKGSHITIGNPIGIPNTWTSLSIDYIKIYDLSGTPSFSSYYSQADALWGQDEYDTATTWAGSQNSGIDVWGCALTSAAMVLSKHDIKSPNGDVSTPQILNNWLKSVPDGYVGNGLVNWLAISRYTKISESAGHAPTSLEYIREDYSEASTSAHLTLGRYPILSTNGHFVVTHDSDSENWVVADPLIGPNYLLPQSGSITRINAYATSHTDLSYMMFVGNESMQFEMSGLQVGLERLDNNNNQASTSAVIATMQKPSAGTYNLVVRGSGKFVSYLYNIDGIPTIAEWTLPPSGVQEYQIIYDHSTAGIREMKEWDSSPPKVVLSSPSASKVNRIVNVTGSVLDENPWRYWLVIENESGSVVAGPGVVYDSNSLVDHLFISWDTTTVADGNYTIKLEARDTFGNKNEDSIVWKSVVVDNSGPGMVEITYPPDGSYHPSSPIRNEWTVASDPSGILNYRVQYEYDDGHTFSNYPYRIETNNWRNHSPASWEQGGVKFRVQAFDSLGNEGDWSSWRHYYYDPTQPTTPGTPISSPNPTNILTQNWSFGASTDLISGVLGYYSRTYSNDASDYLSDWLFIGDVLGISTSLSEGSYFVEVKAKDRAGNNSAIARSSDLIVDMTLPSVPTNLHFENPSKTCGGYTNQKYITVDWGDASDNYMLAGYDYSINYPKVGGGRGDWATYFVSSSYRGSLNEGLHIIKLRSVDKAGNKSSWSQSCELTYDSIVPTLLSKTEWDLPWYNQPQIAVFEYSDSNLRDDYAALSCEINNEGEGVYCSVSSSVCDKAENCNTESVVSNPLNLDLTAPTANITLWGNTIAGTAKDVLSGVERVEVVWKKDGGVENTSLANGKENWSITLPQPSVGSYEVSVFAYDYAGNKSSKISKIFTINPSDGPIVASGSVEGVSTQAVNIVNKTKLTNSGSVLGESTVEPSPSLTPLPTPTPSPTLLTEPTASQNDWLIKIIAIVFGVVVLIPLAIRRRKKND